MKIAVSGNDIQWEELTKEQTDIQWTRLNSISEFSDSNNTSAFDAFFLLDETQNYRSLNNANPVFIGNVSQTLQELALPENFLRINGWSTFLSRNNWEIAGDVNNKVKDILALLHKNYTPVPDEPGLIAARVIAMIINEAYFALGEEVSTKNEIDIAMKLGTNYPFGPFEWCERIGIKNIFRLLKKLSIEEPRYEPAPALTKETTV